MKFWVEFRKAKSCRNVELDTRYEGAEEKTKTININGLQDFP